MAIHESGPESSQGRVPSHQRILQGVGIAHGLPETRRCLGFAIAKNVAFFLSVGVKAHVGDAKVDHAHIAALKQDRLVSHVQ